MFTIFLKGHLDLETDTDGGQYEDTRGVGMASETNGSPCLQGQARAAGSQERLEDTEATSAQYFVVALQTP